MRDERKPAQRSEPSFPTTAFAALLLILIANFALQPLTEPDFGWHLRTGLDLLQ